MEDRDFQVRKEEYGWFHDRIQGTSHKDRYKQVTCDFLIKEKYITKTILEYLPIVVLEILKEWKVVITSVRQRYESIERWHDYKIETGTMYRGQGLPMTIGKSKENFKDGKPRCFNCDVYGHMAKDCRKLKKEKDTRKCYKCKQVGHITKDCRTGQKMKNWSVQEETDKEAKDKEQCFGEDPE